MMNGDRSAILALKNRIPPITGDSKMTRKNDLQGCADYLADQYRSELLPEIQPCGWPLVWRTLLNDLRRKCPGFSEIAYAIALNQGFAGKKQSPSANRGCDLPPCPAQRLSFEGDVNRRLHTS
jgi:hypothetical protein